MTSLTPITIADYEDTPSVDVQFEAKYDKDANKVVIRQVVWDGKKKSEHLLDLPQAALAMQELSAAIQQAIAFARTNQIDISAD